MRRAAILLIPTFIAFSGCAKKPGDVLSPDSLPSTRVEYSMASDDTTKSGPIPQRMFLTVEDRINWLGSARVKNSLKDFGKFEKLFPEIVTQIGRALMDCNTDADLKSLISKIGFIANHTPTRALRDFGVLEPPDDMTLCFGILSDRDASQDQKLGVLALMMLSSNVHRNLMFGDPSDVFYPNAPPSKGQVVSQLEALKGDPKLQKPIDCFLKCFNDEPGFLLETVPISQLSALRTAFN